MAGPVERSPPPAPRVADAGDRKVTLAAVTSASRPVARGIAAEVKKADDMVRGDLKRYRTDLKIGGGRKTLKADATKADAMEKRGEKLKLDLICLKADIRTGFQLRLQSADYLQSSDKDPDTTGVIERAGVTEKTVAEAANDMVNKFRNDSTATAIIRDIAGKLGHQPQAAPKK